MIRPGGLHDKESSFFLRTSFLLARSQLGCQPSSILDLVAPSPHRIDSQFFPVFLQSCPPFTFPIFNLSHYPLPREILFSPSRTMSHPLELSLANQRLDRLQTKHLQQLALRQSLVIRIPHYFPNQSPHQVPIPSH